MTTWYVGLFVILLTPTAFLQLINWFTIFLPAQTAITHFTEVHICEYLYNAYYNDCDYLSMQGLNWDHVRKWGPSETSGLSGMRFLQDLCNADGISNIHFCFGGQIWCVSNVIYARPLEYKWNVKATFVLFVVRQNVIYVRPFKMVAPPLLTNVIADSCIIQRRVVVILTTLYHNLMGLELRSYTLNNFKYEHATKSLCPTISTACGTENCDTVS